MSDNQSATVRTERWFVLSDEFVDQLPCGLGFRPAFAGPVARLGRNAGRLPTERGLDRKRFADLISVAKRLAGFGANIGGVVLSVGWSVAQISDDYKCSECHQWCDQCHGGGRTQL